MFRSHQPDQQFLFPPSPRDWLPDNHLVYFISDAVDALDLRCLKKKYRSSGKGNLPYSPEMLLKVVILGYCSSVFSSRKLAKATEENIAFRMLVGDQIPNHRTICRFRERHLEEFEKLFVQVIQLAQENGLVKMGMLAIDGSKVKANASKHKAMSYERMQTEEARLRKEIRELTKKAAEIDREEDRLYGDARGDEIPAELCRRETRKQKIQEAKQRLEGRKRIEAAEQGKDPGSAQPEPKDQENFTDADSRIMKTGSGNFEQCYNAQIAVDEENQIIVAAEIVQAASDCHQLIPTLEAAINHTGKEPKSALADAGYRSERNFQALEDKDIRGFVALGRERTESKPVRTEMPATARMQRRVKGPRGRKIYAMRKSIVEPVFGWIKNVMGFRHFSLRGLRKVTGEWKLVCLCLNLKRLQGRMQCG